MMIRTTFISGPPPGTHPDAPSRAVPAAPAPATFRKLRLVKVLFTPPLSPGGTQGAIIVIWGPSGHAGTPLACENARCGRDGHDAVAENRTGLPSWVAEEAGGRATGRGGRPGGGAGLLRVLQAPERREHRGPGGGARALPGPLPRPRAGPPGPGGIRGVRGGGLLRHVRDDGQRVGGEARLPRLPRRAAAQAPVPRLRRARRGRALPARRHSDGGRVLIPGGSGDGAS